MVVRQPPARRQDQVGVAGRLVQIDIDRDHELEAIQRLVEAPAIRDREHGIARERDHGTYLAVARRFTSCVLQSASGRARQMNHAAAQAPGDIFLFVHADTWLPADGLEAVRAVMQRLRVVGGAFRLAFRPSTPALRLIAWGANVRTRFGKLPYGDQALFIRRSCFEALGGYADVPFLEDVQLVRAMRRQGTVALVPHAVQTSGRRWQHEGLVSTTVRNNVLMALYFCGVSPATLKRWYGDTSRRVAP